MSLVFFVAVGLESLTLRLRAAPAFGAMFDDFGGRDALPTWTRAWVYGAWPYFTFPALAAGVVGLAALSSGRAEPRRLLWFVAIGVALLVGNTGAALFAFYLPVFTLAG